MKRNVSIQYFIGYLFLLMIILGGCSNTDRSGKQQNGGESEDGIREKPGKCQIIRPQMYERFTLGTEIQIEVGQTNSIPGIDSMLFVVGGEKIGLLTEEPYTFGWISNTDRRYPFGPYHLPF